eukprot:5476666-Alexandrium_andersonii.AAC.1
MGQDWSEQGAGQQTARRRRLGQDRAEQGRAGAAAERKRERERDPRGHVDTQNTHMLCTRVLGI